MVNPPPTLQTIPTETWVKATWEDFLTFADDPTLVSGRFYYDEGEMRIEMAPLGSAHGQDNCIISTIIVLVQDLRNCHMRSQPASGKGMSESAASAGSGGSRRIRSDVAQSSQSIECVSRVIGSGRWLTRGEARERFLGRKLEIRKISQLQAQ